jgi:hypothetical protein
MHSFIKACFYATLAVDHAEQQNLEKNPRIGLCNPPSGFLCLTFCEMAAFAQTTRHGEALNSSRPKPWWMAACQNFTTQESTQRTVDMNWNTDMLHGPPMADLKDTSVGHNCAKVPYDLNEQ